MGRPKPVLDIGALALGEYEVQIKLQEHNRRTTDKRIRVGDTNLSPYQLKQLRKRQEAKGNYEPRAQQVLEEPRQIIQLEPIQNRSSSFIREVHFAIMPVPNHPSQFAIEGLKVLNYIFFCKNGVYRFAFRPREAYKPEAILQQIAKRDYCHELMPRVNLIQGQQNLYLGDNGEIWLGDIMHPRNHSLEVVGRFPRVA